MARHSSGTNKANTTTSAFEAIAASTGDAAKRTTRTTKLESAELEVMEVVQGDITFFLLGQTPLVHNRYSEKAKRVLLFPSGRKNAVEKATTLKHSPVDEYRDSPHRVEDEGALLAMPAVAFKKAMGTAALDLPGVKKAQIGRLVYVKDEYIPIYGIPKLFMAPVRSADINHTPDIRTRAICPRWACKIKVTFARPLIREQSISRLLAAAGITVGVGDGRVEKGTFSFGTWKVVPANDPEWLDIVKNEGKKPQLEALKNPMCYDKDSSDLLTWYEAELDLRKSKGAVA